MPRPRALLRQPSNSVGTLLSDIFAASQSGSVRKVAGTYNCKPGFGIRDQTDVVSEELCDDIIKYLAPTLEKHKGCTLLDFFPGPCVWSSKLHEFLQPKKHILIEPDDRYFEPFIKPLLEKPRSTYHHTYVEHEHPHNYLQRWRIIADAEGLATEMGLDSPEKTDLRSLRTDLLTTGNWARKFMKPKQALSYNNIADSRSVLSHLARRPTSNEAFHASGLVRGLWWLPEEVKTHAFVTRIAFRLAHPAWLESSCAITEVAGVTPYTDYAKLDGGQAYRAKVPRWEGFEAEGDKRVSERMEAANIAPPQGRELLLGSTPSKPRKSKNRLQSPFNPVIETPKELQKSIDACDARILDIYPSIRQRFVRTDGNVRLLERASSEIRHKYVLDALKRSAMTANGPSYFRAALVADVAIWVVNLEANFKRIEENHPNDLNLETMRKKIISFSDQVFTMTEAQSVRGIDEIEDLIDEQIAFYSDGKILMRNQREYEPLQADPSDFWPTKPLTLLDMTPYRRDLAVPDLADQAQAARMFYALITVFRSSRTPITEALDRLYINAGKDLPPMCPSMTDVRKGGRLDPKHLRVRCLTGGMMEELTKAFFEWPFRPSNWETAFLTAKDEGKGSAKGTDDSDDGSGETSANKYDE